jgi:hypothetical protein
MKGTFLVRGLIPALAAGLLALPAGAAPRPVERIRLAAPGVPRVFPRSASIQLSSPPGYSRATASGFHGSWTGPEYWASGNTSIRGRTSIEWTVKFNVHSSSARRAAFAGLTQGWPYFRKDPIAIPHVAGGRVIGTIIGYTVLDRADPPLDASYEGALAFPIAHKAFGVVDFVLDHPPTDSAGDAGTYLVNGSVRPSVWAQGQAFWSFSRVRLIGSLPPRRVKLGVSQRHTLRGRVVDRFHHPVVHARVSVERRTKRGWKQAGKARTNLRGRFSIAVEQRAVYRAVARVGKATAQSRRVLAGGRG